MTGEEMERMDEQMLAARISRTRVFAHVSPEHQGQNRVRMQKERGDCRYDRGRSQ